MSVETMGQVWGLDLSPGEKLVLLALADHADQHGRNAYPGVDLLAWKSGYDERQVRRILKSLEARGVIITDGPARGGRGRTNVYRIAPENAPKKPALEPAAVPAKRRSKPPSPDTPSLFGGGNESGGDADKGGHFAPLLAAETRTFEALKEDICDTKRRTFEAVKEDTTPACASTHAGGTIRNHPWNHPEQQHAREGLDIPDPPAVAGKAVPSEAAAAFDFVSQMVQALRAQGVDADSAVLAQTITALTSRHGEQAVARQVGWLPHRTGTHRLRVLAASLRGAGYEDPTQGGRQKRPAQPNRPPEDALPQKQSGGAKKTTQKTEAEIQIAQSGAGKLREALARAGALALKKEK